MTQRQLLDEIEAYLEEEGFICARGPEWCDDQSDSLVVLKSDGWPGIVSVCCLTPPELPPMVTFWVPVLIDVGIGLEEEEDEDLPPEEEPPIEQRAIDQVDLLNHDQLIGRWSYRHDSNRVYLNHELLAVDVTKDQVLGVLEILMRDADAGEFLQERLGGISWDEFMQQVREGLGRIEEARAERARKELDEQAGD